MTTETAKPAIEQYDNALRYMVPSSKGDSVYLVDLGAYGGNGMCDCPDFQCRHSPILKTGAKPNDKLRCKHIRAARTHLTDRIIKRLRHNASQET